MPGNNRLFISHTHGDNELCLPLLAALDAWDVDYWFDVQQLDAGQQLSQRLQQAIAERDIFIRVLTPATPQSFWMTQELTAFRGLQGDDAKAGRAGKRRVILLALTPDAPREQMREGDLALDTASQPQAAWLKTLRDAVGVSSRPRPLSRRAVIGMGAAAAAGIVAVSAGGTLLLTGGARGAAVSAAPVPKTTQPTPTTQATANRVKWSFRASAELGMVPAVGGGVVYLLAGDGLYALAAADGAIKWHKPKLQAGINSGLLLDGDTLYVASDNLDQDVGVAALAAADGSQHWVARLANTPGGGAPALANGTLYVANGGAITAIATGNGSALWTAPYAQQGTKAGPMVANGQVFVGAEDNTLHVLDAAGGYPLWRYTVGGQIGATAAVGGGAVYFTAEDGYFYALDIPSRAPRWPAVKIGYLEDATPLVRGDTVYVGSDHGFLNAFNVHTGALIWQGPAGVLDEGQTTVKNGAAVNVAPAIANSTIYAVATSDSATSVYAFDLSDGSAQWHYDAVDGGSQGHESRPIVSEGQLYYCGNGQTLFALGL